MVTVTITRLQKAFSVTEPRAHKEKIYGRREKPAAKFLITSKFFITVSVDMGRAIRCHRQDMKTSIINGSEVFRLSVAIQM